MKKTISFNLDPEQTRLVVEAMKGERRHLIATGNANTKLVRQYDNLIQYFEDKTAEKIDRLVHKIAEW